MSFPTSKLHDDITDVPGIRVGNAQDEDSKTGVTVILPPSSGAPAGLHVGGSAPSTRQMDSLRPSHVVDRVHGICLCGGSAFGLDAGGGVLAYLEEKGVGFQVVGRTIPIVPSAAIFDLNVGNGSIRPDASMGRRACENASGGPVAQGSVGVGTGASVGKLFGIEQAMKGGLGSASCLSDDLVVGGLVVVNAYGDIIDMQGNVLSGCRVSPASLEPADSARLLREGKARSRPRFSRKYHFGGSSGQRASWKNRCIKSCRSGHPRDGRGDSSLPQPHRRRFDDCAECRRRGRGSKPYRAVGRRSSSAVCH